MKTKLQKRKSVGADDPVCPLPKRNTRNYPSCINNNNNSIINLSNGVNSTSNEQWNN